MWARAATISDQALVNFDIKKDLVEVRAGPTSYGVIILGKLRLPAVNDELGEGFVHVRIHDPPNRVGLSHSQIMHPLHHYSSNWQGVEDVRFHSIFTDEGKRDEDGHAERYQAIQTRDFPLEFFNE